MLTRMTEEDWATVLELFRACRSRRGAKGRNDRRFLEAVHDFCVHTITWRALPAEGGNWNSVWKRFWRLSQAGVFGGFKWSSQHLDGGGCDEGWETALGSGAPSRVAGVAWPTRRGAAGEPAAVLGGDRGGSVERGRGDRGRRVARGGGPLVPGGGRHATDDPCAISEAAIGAVSGVR